MLGIFNRITKKKASTGKSETRRAELDRDSLISLMPHFSIGNKAKYFPEYKQELTLTTTIIAYAINNELVYSNSDISWTQEEGETRIFLNGEPLKKIESFYFIVPTVSRGEEELDYTRKEKLGKDGGFTRGNNITLKGEQHGGRLPMVESTVRKQMMLKEGHYIGHRVAILDVDPAEFSLIEQRSHVRLKTEIQGQIQARPNKEPLSCTMVDFSDRAARIIYHGAGDSSSRYREGSMITFSFDLPKSAEERVIRGTVIRNHEETVVMTLDNIMREKAFEKMEPFDIMEIKANLLQSPQL